MKFILILISFLIFVIHSSAATFYISVNGDDDDDGSQQNPWASIQYAVETMQPGDMTIVSAGTYSEQITTERNGQNGNRIVLKGENGAIIDGSFRIRHQYFTIDGFEMINDGQNVFAFNENGDYCEILNNNVHDWGDARLLTMPRNSGVPNGPNGCLIKNNWFHGSDRAWMYFDLGGSNHIVEENEIGPGVVVEDCFRPFGDNHIIRKNYIHDMTSGGGHTDIFQIFNDNGWRVRNLLFEKNFINGWEGQAWMVDVTNDAEYITIRNNVFINVRQAGQSYCPYTKVFNNTFINSATQNCWMIMLRGQDGRGHARHSEVKNNIFYETGCHNNSGWYTLDGDTESTFEGDYNLVYPAKRSSSFVEAHGINGEDPQFIDVAGTNYRLSSSSPAIDGGIVISSFNDDHDGNARTYGASWDIGAFEFTDSNSNSPSSPQNIRISPE
jgi:hypothetical protein